MATKAPETFTASDGEEFDSLDAAEKHEHLVDAEGNYNAARRVYATALWETQNTADGEPFDLGLFADYYYVSRCFGPPDILTVSFGHYNCDLDDSDRTVIWQDLHDGKGRRSYCISELFKHRNNAERACLEMLEEYMKEISQLIIKMQERVRP